MKTAVLAFKDRTTNSDFADLSAFIRFLNGYTLYADSVTVLSINDKNGLIAQLSADFDLLFIYNSAKASFYVPSVLTDCGYVADEHGFYTLLSAEGITHAKIVSAAAEKSDGYALMLEAALKDKFSISFGKITFKLYGVRLKEVSETTLRISEKYPCVYFNIADSCGDIAVSLVYGDSAPKKQVDAAVREFISALKKHIYAEDDVSLEQRLHDILKLRKQTVCTAESMTGGRIASKIVSVDGASDVFYEGFVTYDTRAKERRLNVKHSTVVQNTVVSEKVAYEMAAGLLSHGNATVVITITGYAGSDVHPSDDDGLCYIGVGTAEKIQVYKYRFKGTRHENIESAANAAIFLAIKTVENLDSL